MKKPPIIIVAVDEAGGFGKDGKIPWYLPEDLQRFKVITDGHICLMGRITYEEILAARKKRDAEKGITASIDDVLRNRRSFVVTSEENPVTPGATSIRNPNDIDFYIDKDETREIFVIGGRKMFISALSWAEKIYLTVVKGPTYDCDVFFPIEVLNKKWHIVSGQETEKAYFVVYNRK